MERIRGEHGASLFKEEIKKAKKAKKSESESKCTKCQAKLRKYKFIAKMAKQFWPEGYKIAK